jgi:hypothetical protein
MTVKITKDKINVREKLSELDKPSGIAGEAMLRADTPAEQFELINAGRRNLVINGDMRVAQRSQSVAGATGSYETVDRISTYIGSSTISTNTVSQSTDAPTGFSKSLKLECTALGTGDGPITVGYTVEGQDVTPLGWGSSGAKKATLSFWVKSNVTGTYALEAKAYNGASYWRNVNNYTINSSGVWEYKTITIDALTGFTPASDNGGGINLEWWLSEITGVFGTSSASFETWTDSATGSTQERAYGQTAHYLSAVNNYFQITGIQLEVGSVATPFEHRSYGEELALCQRYYHTSEGTAQYYVSFVYNTTDINTQRIMLPVSMRTNPTISFNEPSHINTTGNWGIYGAANGWSGTGYPPIADQVKTSQFGIRFSNVGGVSDHEALIANGGWTADAEI